MKNGKQMKNIINLYQNQQSLQVLHKCINNDSAKPQNEDFAEQGKILKPTTHLLEQPLRQCPK